MTAVVRRQVRLGQLWIDVVSFTEALTRIGDLVTSGAGGAVFTPNVDHLVTAERDDHFRRAYRRADLVVADGTPVIWAARAVGTPLPQKVSGSDLVIPVSQAAARNGWRVYLIGGGPGVAAEAAARLRGMHGTNVVGVDDPRVSPAGVAVGETAVLDRIHRAGAQVVLVGFGAPKQELWIERVRDELAPAVLLAVGAGIDFVAGTQRRAPRWMSRVGLEWFFRLVREPRRLWRRYLVNDPAILLLVGRMLRIPRTGRIREMPHDA